MNFAATISCPTKSRVRSSVASALHPLFAPRSPQTPSLPDARPHSDRFRCGGRESEFLAVKVTAHVVRTIPRNSPAVSPCVAMLCPRAVATQPPSTSSSPQMPLAREPRVPLNSVHAAPNPDVHAATLRLNPDVSPLHTPALCSASLNDWPNNSATPTNHYQRKGIGTSFAGLCENGCNETHSLV